MSNLYRGPSKDASYQISIHLAKRLQRRRFYRNQPIRNKNCLWWPCLLTDGDEMSNPIKNNTITRERSEYKKTIQSQGDDRNTKKQYNQRGRSEHKKTNTITRGRSEYNNNTITRGRSEHKKINTITRERSEHKKTPIQSQGDDRYTQKIQYNHKGTIGIQKQYNHKGTIGT